MRLVLVQPVLRHSPEADNAAAVLEALESSAVTCNSDDVLLLPERFHLGTSRDDYPADVRRTARGRCHVVGGSHHEQRADDATMAADATAAWICSDGGGRPRRARLGVPGSHAGEITILTTPRFVLVRRLRY
jgi:hypothetical protein